MSICCENFIRLIYHSDFSFAIHLELGEAEDQIFKTRQEKEVSLFHIKLVLILYFRTLNSFTTMNTQKCKMKCIRGKLSSVLLRDSIFMWAGDCHLNRPVLEDGL